MLDTSRETLFLWTLSVPIITLSVMGKCYNLYMNPVSYLRDTLSELKQVRWPSRQDTTRLTGIVIFISLLVGAYIGGLDLAFTKLLSYIFK